VEFIDIGDSIVSVEVRCKKDSFQKRENVSYMLSWTMAEML